ncbi:diguanylate cyclase [Vibrio sinaloensis]|uniref:sensor domain-containing diguanylate cyclase n=1 Tax=Photobacterium sp. (strain ATCC 43367) TaxID=379097 RepID=UPI0009DF28C8|nr:diguanylate cyclase [Vibrio sinaloensis]
MALPKILIRTLRPYIILLVLGMIYAAYHQLNQSEKSAYQQSFGNLKTAFHLISSQVEAATSKLYLLNDTDSLKDFDSTAKRILEHSPAYLDIITVDHQTGQYRSVLLNPTLAEQNTAMVWSPLNKVDPRFTVSSVYEKQPDQWVFAVKYQQSNLNEIWIEFDLKYTTQSLRGLRTLSDGYVFVVDSSTGRLVFHPDPQRIGTPSVSYHAGISEMITNGLRFGRHEYYYKGQFKLSVFDSDNPYQWVFISGTDRSDVLSSSYQFSLTAIVIASLLLLAVAFNYLTYQLNQSLADLNNKHDLPDFKHHLRAILDRFCHHKGIQLCFYDSDYGYFSTIDYHGNSHIVLKDKDLANRFSPSSLRYTAKRYADPLAKKLKIDGRHYTIPLFDKGSLIAVIYMTATFPTYRSILRMIRDYSEVALSNLLLHKKLRSKDVMTHLDNKLTIREKIDSNLDKEGIYLAILDIDHFKRINDVHGHQCGDHVILHTAELMKKCFPKPGAMSLARYGGEEFCVLFYANDENDAYEQCELFRQVVEQTELGYEEIEVRYTVSIGITSAQDSQHTTIGRADKALYQAKGLGRNQVVLNTFRA